MWEENVGFQRWSPGAELDDASGIMHVGNSLVFGGSGGIDLLGPRRAPSCEAIHPTWACAHEDISAVDGPAVVGLGREEMQRGRVRLCLRRIHGVFGGRHGIPVAIKHVAAVGVGFHDFAER